MENLGDLGLFCTVIAALHIAGDACQKSGIRHNKTALQRETHSVRGQWLRPIIPTLKRQSQHSCGFEASQIYLCSA